MGGSILQLDFEVYFTKRTRSHLGVDKHSAGHWTGSTNRHLRAIEGFGASQCINMYQNKHGIFNHSHNKAGIGRHNHLNSASIAQIDEFKLTLSSFIIDYVQESVNRCRAALFPMPMKPVVCIHRSKHGSRPETQNAKQYKVMDLLTL